MKFFKDIFLISVIVLGLASFGVAHASNPFNDGFESYSIGDVFGQGDWEHLSGSGTYNVNSTEAHGGTKSLVSTSAGTKRIDKTGGTEPFGEWPMWFMTTDSTEEQQILLLGDGSNPELGCAEIFLNHSGTNKVDIYNMSGGFNIDNFDNIPATNTWFKVTVRWSFSTGKYSAKVNEGSWSADKDLYASCASTGINGLKFFAGGAHAWYIDDIGNTSTEPVITFTDPASASTSTSEEDVLTGTWDNINPVIFHSIRIAFQYTQDGITTISTAKILPITTEEGSFEIPLADFDFDYNGDWNAWAVADYRSLQLSDFLQTSDLTDPTGYHLNIDWESLTTPFAFLQTCEEIDIGIATLPAIFDLPCQLKNFFVWAFVPDSAQLRSLFTETQEKLLNIWPIGYINRVVTIMGDETEVEPPALSYTVGDSITDHTSISGTYTFQVFDHLDTINEITDDVNGRTIWDIFMPFWDTMVYLSLFIVIFTRLMHTDFSHIIEPGLHTQKHENEKKDKGSKGKYDDLKHYTS